MVPSLRLVRLVALGAPFWLLGVLTPGGWLAGAGFLVLLLVLCARDIAQAPRAARVQAVRRLPARFALGEEHTVELALTNLAPIRVRVQIRDELPEALAQLAPWTPVDLPPQGSATCAGRVRALRRGPAEYGNIVVRIQHGLGLVLQQRTLPAPDKIKVYPRFRGVDDYDLLARIDQREEVVRRPRRVHGSGTDFESLRAYVPGEDLRQVDWKATARRGTLISRNRQVEKGQQVAVLLDAGRLMAEVIGECSKLDHAMNAAIMLGYVAQTRGDGLAAACFSNRIESFLPTLRGPALMRRLLETLYAVEARPVESDYWQITAEVMGMLKRRSLVVMMTDVLDAASSAGLINNLKRAAARHLVLGVILRDPRLREAAQSVPASAGETYVKAAASDLLRRRRLALEHLRACGALVLETEPARLSIQLVRRYLEIRKGDLQ